jgi:1,4-alpha-glucan branching enzyme
MGWMNDSLRYIELDPIHRRYDHHLITFPIDWAFTENFILPISHDEVVHGKGSMLTKMPGNEWEKFANLRAYYGYMWAFPGKKLLFMGCEFAQWAEWNHDQSLDWDALKGENHRGIQAWVRDLNHLYRETPALHRADCDPTGFAWVTNRPEESISAFLRRCQNAPQVLAICHFTPVPRDNVRIGVPHGGAWQEVLNSDGQAYGGGNRVNGRVMAEAVPWDGQSHSIVVSLPPLATMIFTAAGQD